MTWQTIDTAPKDEFVIVDLWRPNFGGERLCNYCLVNPGSDNEYYAPLFAGYTCVRDATHWMPVPADPKV